MLGLRDIEYGYPAAGTAPDGLVLRGVSLAVAPGERVALLGHNGSGKSTLLRIAGGGVAPWSGDVLLEGAVVDWRDEESLRAHRAAVGIVGQDPDDQMVASTVFEEVAFGPCNLGLSANEVRGRVARALERCRLAGFDERDVSTLSGGQRQRVALAGVLAMRPRYLLLDEPCSMLDSEARADVLSAVDEAARAGCGVLHVTHELADVIDYDRVLVMEAGCVVWEGMPRELLVDDAACARSRCLVSAALERERGTRLGRALVSGSRAATLSDAPRKSGAGELGAQGGVPVPGMRAEELSAVRGEGETVGADPAWRGSDAGDGDELGRLMLAARDVSFSYDDGLRRRPRRRRYAQRDGGADLGSETLSAIADVSLRLVAGGAVLVSGPTGSGKSTLLRLLAGLIDPSAGSVRVGDAPTSPAMVACSFQRAEDQLFADTVLEDVAFGPHNLGCEAEEATRRAREALRRVGLDPDVWGGRSPFALSGGQMRRVALAGILAMETPFVALDEPTVGLDAEGLRDLSALVLDLRGRGVGVVIVSHDIERCLPLVDELIVLSDGCVARRCPAGVC